MMNSDVRWKQRYQNFGKAIKHLKAAVNQSELSLIINDYYPALSQVYQKLEREI